MIDRDFEQLKTAARSGGINDIMEKITVVHAGFNNYVKSFAALVQAEVKLGLNEKLGLSGSLRTAVHDIETKLKERDDPRLTSSMLMMRAGMKRIYAATRSQYVGDLKKKFGGVRKLLAGADMPPALKADIIQKLEKYQADFFVWAEGALEVTRHGAAMSKQFREIEPVIAEIQRGVEHRYSEAVEAEAATRDTIKLWMLIALGVAVVVVSAVSLLIGRSVSNALVAMVRAMTGLARGELSVAIPGIGRKDEVGEMAGAVQVFKTSMIETGRLRAEQLEMEQRQSQQRKADMHKLADAFEAAVGEIVETVSSSAIELEASANTLTATAERSQDSPPWSRQLPRKPPPMSNRWPPPARN